VEDLRVKLVNTVNDKMALGESYHFINDVLECHVELLSQDRKEAIGLLNALTAIAIHETL
jgi:hypothetical protein